MLDVGAMIVGSSLIAAYEPHMVDYFVLRSIT